MILLCIWCWWTNCQRTSTTIDLHLIYLSLLNYQIKSQLIWEYVQMDYADYFMWRYMDTIMLSPFLSTLQWRYNGRNCVSNHQPHDCLLKFFQAQIKENIKAPRHWPVAEFTADRWLPAQMVNNAENVSIWWLHDELDPWWPRKHTGRQ